MSTTISIPANESGVVRVFSLSMDDTQAKTLKANKLQTDGQRPQDVALGGSDIREAHVEVFPVVDLGDMALPAYLIEGSGIAPSTLEPDRLKLAKIDGWVMIAYSSAFGGTARDITPAASLTLIGTYPQEGIDLSAPIDLSTPSALPEHSITAEPPQKKRPSDAAMSGRIATLALLVAFGVVGLMVWVGS